MMGYIYKHTNKKNGKVYIGKTLDKPEDRWRDHVNEANSGKYNYRFHNAIRKYGEDAFSMEIIEKCSAKSCRMLRFIG